MNTQHTPGDWKFYDPDKDGRMGFGKSDKRIMVLHPDRVRLIAHCQTGTVLNSEAMTKEEIKANARLIAAAPNMLEALQSIGKAIENGDPQDIADEWQHAQAVIAKALETP